MAWYDRILGRERLDERIKAFKGKDPEANMTQQDFKSRTNVKHTHDYIKEYIENKGYFLISEIYKNSRTEKLKICCNENHIFETTFSNFQQGRRCPKCFIQSKTLTYDDVKSYLKKNNYRLLSTEYKNAHVLLNMMCPKKHTFTMSFNNFKYGERRCPICSPKTTSKGEKDILNIVKLMYNGKIIENDKKQIKNYLTKRPLELDIWLPEINKAIEYNGEYYHKGEYKKSLDLIKRAQCEQKGINLLVILEKDWNNNKLNIINNIKTFIGVNNGLV